MAAYLFSSNRPLVSHTPTHHGAIYSPNSLLVSLLQPTHHGAIPSSLIYKSRSATPCRFSVSLMMLLMPVLPRAPTGSGSIALFVGAPHTRDHTQDLPDKILTLVFASLSPAGRNTCSLARARWKEVDTARRHRLSLDTCAMMGHAVLTLFRRFMIVSKLALCYARGLGADRLGNEGAAVVASKLPSDRLYRLKLRAH